MFELLSFLIHFIVAYLRTFIPGGRKAIAAEMAVLRYQQQIANRSKQRAPNLKNIDRFLFGMLPFFMTKKRIEKTAVILKPATILKFHQALVNKKYRLLYSSKSQNKPGPKGLPDHIEQLIIETKQRNSGFGYRQITHLLNDSFALTISFGQTYHVLKKHHLLGPDEGPSWLSFFGHSKDSLWSLDFFRCESALLKSHWVMLVMDQFTRRIIGFAVQPIKLTGIDACRMLARIISKQTLPQTLSSDNDPLFEFHRWQANLRVMDITEIKSIPGVPTSHPFIERLIGTVRRECLDKTLFWNSVDLQRKLDAYKDYYNHHRCHYSLNGTTPLKKATQGPFPIADIGNPLWHSHCNGLFQTPVIT